MLVVERRAGGANQYAASPGVDRTTAQSHPTARVIAHPRKSANLMILTVSGGSPATAKVIAES